MLAADGVAKTKKVEDIADEDGESIGAGNIKELLKQPLHIQKPS